MVSMDNCGIFFGKLYEIETEIYSLCKEIFTVRFEDGKSDQIMEKIDSVVFQFFTSLANDQEPKLKYQLNNEPGVKRDMTLPLKTQRRKFANVLYVMSKMYELRATNKCLTKRELYYENVTRFESQNEVNRAVHALCRILSVNIWQTRIHSTAKGLIAGQVTFIMKNGQRIIGKATGGTLIPQNTMDIAEIFSPAKWILLVEKDAAFQRLIHESVLQRLGPCLFVTGKGYPDVNTRMLVCLLAKHLRVPILALVDADPHGIDIMCTYRFGSKAMSSHSPELACDAVRWLGVHPTDISLLDIESVPLTTSDRAKLKSMLTRPVLSSNEVVRAQIQALLDGGVKAEMEGFLKISYRTESYLHSKIVSKEYV